LIVVVVVAADGFVVAVVAAVVWNKIDGAVATCSTTRVVILVIDGMFVSSLLWHRIRVMSASCSSCMSCMGDG